MPGERVARGGLAAGLSSRMGTNKMLLELGGGTLVRRAVATALAAGLDPVLAVVGHESDRVQSELAGLRCTPVLNRDYALGMNTSLRAGIRALPEGVDAAGGLPGGTPPGGTSVVGARGGGAGGVLLGDQPLGESPVGAGVGGSFPPLARAAGRLPLGRGGAPPILYGSALFGELRALEAEACGKSVVKRHRAEAVELDWPAERLTDLDLPDDVRRVRDRLEAS